MQFLPPDDEHMCSKHVEARNKLIVKQKFCASSWLITEINVRRKIYVSVARLRILLTDVSDLLLNKRQRTESGAVARKHLDWPHKIMPANHSRSFKQNSHQHAGWQLKITQIYRGADKSLARPGRKQAPKHVRDARNFNNIETQAFINFFFLHSKAPKEIHAIVTETLACFLPGRAKDLSAHMFNSLSCIMNSGHHAGCSLTVKQTDISPSCCLTTDNHALITYSQAGLTPAIMQTGH